MDESNTIFVTDESALSEDSWSGFSNSSDSSSDGDEDGDKDDVQERFPVQHQQGQIDSNTFVQNESIFPPPEKEYDTWALANQAIQDWTRKNGYALSITHSKKNVKGVTYRRQLSCSKGRFQNTRYLNDSTRLRRTSTTKQNCPMKLWAIALDPKEPEGPWAIQWIRNNGSHIHNHSAVTKGSTLPIHRRNARTPAMEQFLLDCNTAGLPASNIQTMLRSKFGSHSFQTKKDINNFKRKIRKILLEAQTPAEGAIQLLQDLKFHHSFDINETTKELERMWMSHPTSIDLLKRNFDIIYLDCTFKTNRYNRPVLNICGSMANNKTFQIGLAILPSEREDHFIWAFQQVEKLFRQERIPLPQIFISDRDRACLNALSAVFPSVPTIICAWHRGKDIEAYARRTFPMVPDSENPKEYYDQEITQKFIELTYAAVYADTEAEFEKVSYPYPFVSNESKANSNRFGDNYIPAGLTVLHILPVNGGRIRNRLFRPGRINIHTLAKQLLLAWKVHTQK